MAVRVEARPVDPLRDIAVTKSVRIRAPRPARDAAMQLLVACARDTAPEPEVGRSFLARSSEPLLLALADFHRVAGIAHDALGDSPVLSAALAAQLRARYRRAVDRHMRILWALEQVRETLDGVGCRWAVVKGPVAVETLYGGAPGRRQYQDLDVLVDPQAFGDVLAAFERAGSPMLDVNWVQLRRGMRGEVHLRLPGDIPLDLHWNLIDMYRGRMRLDTAELLGRTRQTELAGVSVPTLEHEDALVHLAFHAAYSGGDRLVWLKDVERAASVWQPDWDSVVERAYGSRIAASVGLILYRAREVLGAPVPEKLPERLMGRRMMKIAALMDRLSPWEYGFGRLAAPTRLFSRSIGHGVVRGTGWVLWRSLRNLDPWQEARTSTFTPKGNERDRLAFLDAVALAGRRTTR